ncbi:hypothetical protein EYC84_002014 [Monilinia fructicola]|uniref:Uncharacterized protein n=1 Tax=Monilinia fructicola TaxID=38448 RepID=A0A5M9JVE2_MONFR|nr:hypothetical protein EYC84_002014 [Monilinia fructicola]
MATNDAVCHSQRHSRKSLGKDPVISVIFDGDDALVTVMSGAFQALDVFNIVARVYGNGVDNEKFINILLNYGADVLFSTFSIVNGDWDVLFLILYDGEFLNSWSLIHECRAMLFFFFGRS